MRSSLQNVRNFKIKLLSGSQVTANELIRNQIGEAADWVATDEDLIKYFPEIRKGLEAEKRNIASGAGPDAYSLYSKRQAGDPLTSFDYIRQKEIPKESGGKPAGMPQKDWERLQELRGRK
jgi:hypothetical protein